MYARNVLAVSGVFIAAVAAVPHQHHRREIVWKTLVDEVVVTIPVTETVWIEPGETAPAEYSHESYSAPATTVEPAPAAYTPSSSAAPVPAYTPETSSSSSVYVAPAPAYTPETSTTSVYVAPSPSTTSVYVAPTPSSTYVAPAPSSSYVAPVESSAPVYSGSSGSGLSYGMAPAGSSFTGDMTYYEPGLGSCGFTNSSDQYIVAISHVIFQSYTVGGNTNGNPLCKKWVTITGYDGTQWPAQIVDSCPGCDQNSLDLTTTLFDKVVKGGEDVGRATGVTWTMN